MELRSWGQRVVAQADHLVSQLYFSQQDDEAEAVLSQGRACSVEESSQSSCEPIPYPDLSRAILAGQ